jgi:hypothetical protein
MTFLRSAARAALATCSVYVLAHCGARATLESGNPVSDDGGGATPTPEAGATGDATTPLSCPAAGPALCASPEAGPASPDAPAEAAQVVGDGGPFTCGGIICVESEYCADHAPNVPHDSGAPLMDTYLCVPSPLSCQAAGSLTCDCIESGILPGDACSSSTPGVTCTTDAAGHITIHCQGI